MSNSPLADTDWEDTSSLIGWDGMVQVLAENWNMVVGGVATYGPILVVVALIGLLYWALYRAGSWLLRRVAVRFAGDSEQRAIFFNLANILLRLTFIMLATISALAVMPDIDNYAGPVLRVYLLLLLLFMGWNVVKYFLDRQSRRWGLDASLTLLIDNLARILWVLLAIYMVFSQFGINLLPILGGLGVFGLAVGFAAQDILANFIAGITMLLDRPFRIGDWIRTANHEGQVTGITLRTTRIRTRDNEYISIPNQELAGSVVTNLSQGGPLRIGLVVGVAYKTQVPEARKVLIAAMDNHPDILHERAPQVLVQELNSSSVDLLMRFWVTADNIGIYPVVLMQVREAAKQALDDAGIEIPFPHLQMHIDGARGLREDLPWPLTSETAQASSSVDVDRVGPS